MGRGARRPYIDWTRGVAVLLMIEAHVFDSWTSVADRSGFAYRNLMILGGFAAPLFLWLAGLAGVLSAERTLRKTGSRRDAGFALCRRGAEVLLLAFLFRIQAFVVSPGKPAVSILRVDILNVLGPSLMLVAIVWLVVRSRTAAVAAFSAGALLFSLITPWIRSAGWVDGLPPLFQWYLRPAGTHTTFTVFPWTGFSLAGAALGAIIAGAGSRKSEAAVQAGAFAIGLVLLAAGFYGAYNAPLFGDAAFWTTSPEFFVIRIGVMMAALAVMYALELALGRREVWLTPLSKLGQASLFVYWIHVEMVYGYLSWPIRRRLDLPQAVFAYLAFCGLMYGAILLRDRLMRRRDDGRRMERPAVARA